MADQALRPLGIGEILDVAIKLYARNFKALAKIVLVIEAPVQLLSFVVLLSTLPKDSLSDFGTFGTSSSTSLASGSDPAAYFAGITVNALLGVIAAALATAACLKAVSDAYLGAAPDWRESLRFALRRTGSLLWLALLLVIFLFLAAMALVIPAVWLYVAWAVATPALLLEQVKGTAALRRSFGLVRHRWWPSFATLLVGFILAGIVAFVVQALFVGLVFAGAEDSGVLTLLLSTIGGLVAGVLARPFQAAVTALLYFDLRVRKEGFDLQLLAQRLGLPEPDSAAVSVVPPERPTPGTDPGAPPYWPPPPDWTPPSAPGAEE